MTKAELIIQALQELYAEGVKLAQTFQNGQAHQFQYDYQRWYSKAMKSVAALAPDRYEEFRRYYEIDPKRKSLGYGTYVIQDYVKNVVPNRMQHPEFDARQQVLTCFLNQLTILHAITDRASSVLADIEGALFAEIEDNELAAARKLSKINLRAAGALVGVVIEAHLQKVALVRGVKISKKNPTVADLNDPLKAASVYDLSTWRKITYLADLRNLCAHKKDTEPTPDQVEELIQGGEWLVKNIY